MRSHHLLIQKTKRQSRVKIQSHSAHRMRLCLSLDKKSSTRFSQVPSQDRCLASKQESSTMRILLPISGQTELIWAYLASNLLFSRKKRLRAYSCSSERLQHMRLPPKRLTPKRSSLKKLFRLSKSVKTLMDYKIKARSLEKKRNAKKSLVNSHQVRMNRLHPSLHKHSQTSPSQTLHQLLRKLAVLSHQLP